MSNPASGPMSIREQYNNLWKNHQRLLRELEDEMEIRESNPTVQLAYDQYMTLLKLCRDA